MTASLRLILASGSPRRRELLGRLGIDFDVVVPEVDESVLPGESPRAHVVRVAQVKADAISARYPSHPVLAADTMVVCEGASLGKPGSDNDALAMLGRLAGRTHQVLTAVCVRYRASAAVHVEETSVSFVAASSDLLRWYVATGEPYDKAGGYAVQGAGALLVGAVEGNVQSVVGLPLAPLPGLLNRIGLRLTPSGPRLLLTRAP